MLLIIEALLLVSAALGQDHRTAVFEGQIFPLDMAENSVDDKFYHCTKKMERRVQTEYLNKEISNSQFGEAWKYAEKNHNLPGENLSKNHTVAIFAYTDHDHKIYDIFNNAVHTDKDKYKNKTYDWYSLHFWLTEAIQILKKTQTECFDTYRGAGVQFDKDVKGKEVRFGLFASSSLKREVAESFGTKSCFEIRTCEGADLTKYSKYCDEKEVLIPPYETFKVTEVKTQAEQEDLWCDTVFVLKSYKTRSFLNCAASSGNQVAFVNVLLFLTYLCNVVIY